MRELFPSESASLFTATQQAPQSVDNTKREAQEASSLDTWNLISEKLKQQLGEEAYKKWITPLSCYSSGEDELVLLVPSLGFYQIILSKYLEDIERCKNALGFEHISLVIDLKKNNSQNGEDETKSLSNEKTKEQNIESSSSEQKAPHTLVLPPIVEPTAVENEPNKIEQNGSAHTPKDKVVSQSFSTNSKLNTTYTFDTFVRGPSNQFALAACYNVAENPGKTYNPLFLYGATGLGKTHLLHSVGNHILKKSPGAVIAYISSERFMNELIYCLRHNKISYFRQKYRHCDLFLMDDIQFISGNKAATQEEFFHTFNTLYENKKQIIITSDLFPQDIPDIEERLRNRFQWGLIADIQAPDVEHRIAILLSKAEQLGVHLSMDVAEYIAGFVKKNIRELEGALHRLAAFAALHGRALDKELAVETFNNILPEESAKPTLLVDTIQKVVSEHFQIKTSDLKSKKRHKAFTLPRQIAMYLSRKLVKTSYPEIGEKFGGKDHSTVMHAVKKIQSEKKKNMDLLVQIESMERALERLQ